MTTLQQIAGALQVRLETVTGLRVYSEPEERAYDPSAEIIDLGRRRRDVGGGQVARFAVDVSVSSEDRGWAEAVQKLRPYLDATGASSLEAAVEGDQTLGGTVDYAVVVECSGIRRAEWGDGYRWAGRVIVEVSYDP